ncbi:MAG: TOBE domain-containing protein, partial [Nitrospirota bacterium]|nr:TOBE domain-containing protein [Nitrospirota bacterium]
SPTEIYERPATRFVTGFIGESNILDGRVRAIDGERLHLAVDGFEVTAPARDGVTEGQQVAVVVRPEHLLLGDEAERTGYNRLRARILDETYQGSLIRYDLDVQGTRLVAESHNRIDRSIYPVDSEITIGWNPDGTAVLTD